MPASERPASRFTLEWTGGESFRATSPTGVEIVLDGDAEKGFSPTQALACSLGACMGIDVVLILRKMRLDLKGIRIAIEGQRREEPPRYFERFRMAFEITGAAPAAKVERAIELSRKKYCSVLHTLKPEVELEISFEILDS